MEESSGGSGLGWVAVVLLIVGGVWLYQREGGKVFEKPAPPPPPQIFGLEGKLKTGIFNYDLEVTNNSADPLADVAVKFTFLREDGQVKEIEQFWNDWRIGEVKKIRIPANRYQKVDVKGTAVVLKELGPTHRIDTGWSWNWK